GQQSMRPIAQDLAQLIDECSWLDQFDDAIVGHGISLLRWRSGGVEHPHDMPPFRLTPSPTSGHSSPVVGFYLSSSRRCQRLPPRTDDPRLTINGWPADPADCTRPYCLDPKANLGWRPQPNDFSCKSSQRIDKSTYEALFSRGQVYQGSPPP